MEKSNKIYMIVIFVCAALVIGLCAYAIITHKDEKISDAIKFKNEYEALNELVNENSDEKRTSMVVCPSSLALNWFNEINKFAPTLKTTVIAGNAEERKRFDNHSQRRSQTGNNAKTCAGHKCRFAAKPPCQYTER